MNIRLYAKKIISSKDNDFVYFLLIFTQQILQKLYTFLPFTKIVFLRGNFHSLKPWIIK